MKRYSYLFTGAAFIALSAALVIALGIPLPLSKTADIAIYVNSTAIPTSECNKVLTTLVNSLKRPLTKADRQNALELFAHEELLLQEALLLDLPRSDPLVRKNMIQTFLRSVIA